MALRCPGPRTSNLFVRLSELYLDYQRIAVFMVEDEFAQDLLRLPVAGELFVGVYSPKNPHGRQPSAQMHRIMTFGPYFP